MTGKAPEPTLLSISSTLIEMGETMVYIQQDLRKIEHSVGEIREDLSAALGAIDTDAITLINHERRIGKLERGNKV